ncbi:ComF family protein [Patescibacteria group bacterium]|nr:ComF family protein [Patescibacteria group bacterium]MBU4579488.1 ComF family protein [Patescibacteria group bacterium]
MAIKSVLKKISVFILDIIFPIYCLGCGAEGKWICSECSEKVELLKKQACPVCGVESRTGARCFNCRAKTELDGVIAAAAYFGKERKESLVKKAIHIFKYRFVKDLAEPLAAVITRQLKNRQIAKPEKSIIFGPYINDKIIIPVPLHLKRFRWRGFNQADLLADNIAKYFDLPLEKSALARRKNNIPQVEVRDRRERMKNIKDAFICVDGAKVKDKIVILVDDVATTSATLGECAKALKNSGAKEVWGVVVARGG